MLTDIASQIFFNIKVGAKDGACMFLGLIELMFGELGLCQVTDSHPAVGSQIRGRSIYGLGANLVLAQPLDHPLRGFRLVE